MADIEKTCVVKAAEPDEGRMALINEHSMRRLGPEDVFTFDVTCCQDCIPDRDGEYFKSGEMENFAGLYVGRPLCKDHRKYVDGMVGKVYSAWTEETEAGNRVLAASCYIPRTKETEAVVTAMETGVVSEVSVSCSVEHAVCSICGNDKTKAWCPHHAGLTYGDKVCSVELSGVNDVYELSLVCVPSQRCAAVRKSYGVDGPEGPDGADDAPDDGAEVERDKEPDGLAVRIRLAGFDNIVRERG